MLNKKIILFIGSVALFTSCKMKESLMNEDLITNPVTYTQLDEVLKSSKHVDFIGATTNRKIYILEFSEQAFENNGIMQRATLPKGTVAATEKYEDLIGHKQVLYLVKLSDTAFIFCSLKFNSDKVCIGHGPLSAGRLSNFNGINVISFDYEIIVEKDKTTKQRRPKLNCKQKRELKYKPRKYFYKLKPVSLKRDKKNKQQSCLFVLSKNTNDTIAVEKIVANHYNKIGGKDWLIFDMKDIMPDHELLNFKLKTK